MVRPTRRGFLRALAWGGAAAAAPGPRHARAEEAPAEAPGPEIALGTGLFSADERVALARLADGVLPGAGAWGAVAYIEGLLGALDADPPHIHAGPAGPDPGWLPLDRVQAHAWRLRILGSAAAPRPGEALLGPLPGLRPLMLAGAHEAAAGFAAGDGLEWVWWRLPGDFRDRFTELVLEGSLGDPLYGGNRDAAGWRAFHFEGGPLGYGSDAPAAHAGHGRESEGEGPDPLGPFTRAALWVLGFFSRRIA